MDIDGKRFILQIWDTAGSERCLQITAAYFRGAHGIMMVYDLTDRQSFDKIKYWNAQIEKHCHCSVCKILVGNKADLSDTNRQITSEDAKNLCDELNICDYSGRVWHNPCFYNLNFW